MKRTITHEYHIDPNERFFDLFAAVLLMAAMVAAALRLSATGWAENLDVTQSMVFWGVLAGLALGKSIFSPRAAFLFSLNYGIFTIPWQLGILFFGPKVEWKERLLSMGGRMLQVLGEISRRDQVTDNMLFLVLMATLFWVLSSYAGYILVRRAGMWQAVLPTGVTALVIESFDPLLERRGWFLASFLFLALLLVARMSFLVNTRRWRESKTHIPADVGYDQMRVALGVVLVLVLLAWNTPALANNFPVFSTLYRDRVEPFRQRITDRMGFMFSSLRSSVGLVSDFYGDQMILGSGSLHTNDTALTVESPGFVYLGQRFYWRARVYDLYQDGRWQTSLLNKQPYLPNVALTIPDSPERIQAVFKFRPQEGIITLYSAAQPLIFSRPGEMQAATNPDGSLDFVALQADPYIRPGEVYEVTAALPSFTEKDLRAAGRDYPAWITERYLQLPEEITPRTRELAQRLAAGYDNPYDIAVAVTNFLRQNIEYTEVIDTPPGRQELMDWFLFEYQKGFCNYYSTAEIVLLRSLGIPARWAVGYAQGEATQVEPVSGPGRNEGNGSDTGEGGVVYTVKQKDAHAWPEVFFPEIGWVEFEPTASQLPIFRPSGDKILLGPLDEEAPKPELHNAPEFDGKDPLAGLEEPQSAKGLSPLSVALSLLGLGVAFGLLGLALFARQHRSPTWLALKRAVQGDLTPLPVRLERSLRRFGLRPPAFLVSWAKYDLLPALSKAYVEIDRALGRLGNTPAPSLTPAERAAALVLVLPQVSAEVDALVGEYQLGTYSPYPADASLALQAGAAIRRRSWMAVFKKLLSRLQEPVQRKGHVAVQKETKEEN